MSDDVRICGFCDATVRPGEVHICPRDPSNHSSLSPDDLAWAHRMKAFLASRSFDDEALTEDDFDKLAEHWKLTLRLARLDLSEFGVTQ